MKIQFLEKARDELDSAIEYYEVERIGLGAEFLEEVISALDRIAKYKNAWHPLSENTRRCQTRRFPYGLIYSVEDEFILIISVSHLHRRPNHWKDDT
jgi:plasmid stabilization system protein ParE